MKKNIISLTEYVIIAIAWITLCHIYKSLTHEKIEAWVDALFIGSISVRHLCKTWS